MRSFGYGIGNGLTPFEEVLEFCKEKGRVPLKIEKKHLLEVKKKKEKIIYLENGIMKEWLLIDTLEKNRRSTWRT